MSMKSKLSDFFFSDYDRRTIVSSTGSFFVSALFALYNGYLGIHYQSLWYGSICIYYILLSILRAILIASDIRISRTDQRKAGRRRKVAFVLTHGILLILNLSLVVPLLLMVKMQKPVEMTLIPAIAMAAYTTYKIVIASINLKKKRKSENILVKELRTINFIDALLSITVLQNTLIMVNHGEGNSSMLTVSALSSVAILVLMLLGSVLGFLEGIKTSNSKA